MRTLLKKISPKVNKIYLFLFCGILWLFAGTLLDSYSFRWLSAIHHSYIMFFLIAGLIASLIIHKYGFTKVANKNIARIIPFQGKHCAFAFMSWKSYLIVIFMMMLGITLRHSSMPKEYLSIIYTGIGTALILSSLIYFRLFLKNIK